MQIYPSLRNKFKDLLQQGKVYYIDSFSVRYANRTYRPVANPLMISFTKWTTLEECIEIPDNFPSITFSLTPFQDVPSLVEKNHFYVGASPFDHICHLCLFPVAALYLSN